MFLQTQGVSPHTGYSLDLPYLATFLDNLFTAPEDADSDRLRHNYSTLAPSTAHHKNTPHSGSHRYLPAEVRIHSTLNHITHAQSITGTKVELGSCSNHLVIIRWDQTLVGLLQLLADDIFIVLTGTTAACLAVCCV